MVKQGSFILFWRGKTVTVVNFTQVGSICLDKLRGRTSERLSV